MPNTPQNPDKVSLVPPPYQLNAIDEYTFELWGTEGDTDNPDHHGNAFIGELRMSHSDAKELVTRLEESERVEELEEAATIARDELAYAREHGAWEGSEDGNSAEDYLNAALASTESRKAEGEDA